MLITSISNTTTIRRMSVVCEFLRQDFVVDPGIESPGIELHDELGIAPIDPEHAGFVHPPAKIEQVDVNHLPGP